MGGHVDVAAYLLQHGAAVDAQCADGCTSLHLAILEDHPSIVELLLAHGACTTTMNFDGETPVDWTDEAPELHALLTA
jgi:ankyrin repeat protein